MLKSKTIKAWAARRGLESLSLAPKLADLTPPTGMLDRETVIDRLAAAIKSGEQITAWSDYDVDGLTSAVIITEGIRALGGRITPMCASRFDGYGYGFSEKACDRVIDSGSRLLVTLDCGSSDHARLKRFKGVGGDALVVDHHLVPAEPLPALGFLNPHRPECGFGFKWLASCGLALNIVAGLRTKLGVSLDVKYWLDLAALGTVADVAPLIGDNRIIVSAGMEAIRQGRRPGMKALVELAKLDLSKADPTGRDIAWRLAPNINAPGRLGSPEIILRLLMATDYGEAKELAAEVGQLSALRRQLTEQMQLEAEEMVQSSGWQHDAAIVVGVPQWNHGIVGITAGRLTEKYQKPTIVIGSEGKGSVRGPSGYRLHQALSACKEFLVKFGGHEAAAGCEVEWEKLNELRKAFCFAIEAQQPIEVKSGEELIQEVDPSDNLLTVLRDLALLEPCGEGNPRPRMAVEGRVTAAKEVRGGHLSLEIAVFPGVRLKGFKVGSGQMATSLTGGKVRLVGDLRPTTFGSAGVEMFVEDLRS